MQRDCPDGIGCGEIGFYCSGGAKEAIVIPAWKLVSQVVRSLESPMKGGAGLNV